MSYQTNRGCPTISRSLRKGGQQTEPSHVSARFHQETRLPHHFAFFAKGWAQRATSTMFMTEQPRNEAAPPFRVLCERVGTTPRTPTMFMKQTRGCPTISRSLRKGGRNEPDSRCFDRAHGGCPTISRSLRKGWAPRTRTHNVPSSKPRLPRPFTLFAKGWVPRTPHPYSRCLIHPNIPCNWARYPILDSAACNFERQFDLTVMISPHARSCAEETKWGDRQCRFISRPASNRPFTASRTNPALVFSISASGRDHVHLPIPPREPLSQTPGHLRI